MGVVLALVEQVRFLIAVVGSYDLVLPEGPLCRRPRAHEPKEVAISEIGKVLCHLRRVLWTRKH